MRRAIASLLAAGLVCGCGQDATLDALAPGGRGRVVAATSGDALVLATGARVRLAGVEAPHGDEPYAAEARAALARLALGREVELLHGGEPKDAFGRVLAQVRETRGRLWLEGALLRQGAVRVRTYADNRALARSMLLEEARARAAGRGLWALAAYRVRLPQEVGLGGSGLVVVEGRVRSVVRDGGRARLDFAEAPGGLAAEVPRAAWDDFAAAGVALASLTGRLVRLRGGVRSDRGRPILRLDHPEQVERLTDAP
ncbi:MAG TPA: thermonuclease family protein [Caulobacteraceae bacterium]|jgi:micrococcal nuclease|nr:thermonuclease family protein [Caulobacteraceae bacterium]